ncbi:MAG: ornithine carbamoyltransferase [Lentisphaerae bacterium]|nr:ornithine carbamoyltransferase [Lentisphaerota bacterium]
MPARHEDPPVSLLQCASLKGRGLLSLDDLTDDELLALLDLAAELKQRKRVGIRGNLLHRKHIAMIFEKTSTRTRCAAAVAAADEGGRTEYLSARDIHLGKKESVADTARVLGRMFDGIFFRGYSQQRVAWLAEYSGRPVWNGLTDESHPTQALADLLTVRERFGAFKGVKVVYVGDGRNNVANSLMAGCAKVGMDFVDCTPPSLAPPRDLVAAAERVAAANGGSVAISHDPALAVRGANVVYTDVWASMGEESKMEERIALLKPYRVDMALMNATGNAANGALVFLHCLPAFHDRNTDLTKDIGAMEVTDDVFESKMSLVFDQAENRMHTIKALFVAAL